MRSILNVNCRSGNIDSLYLSSCSPFTMFECTTLSVLPTLPYLLTTVLQQQWHHSENYQPPHPFSPLPLQLSCCSLLCADSFRNDLWKQVHIIKSSSGSVVGKVKTQLKSALVLELGDYQRFLKKPKGPGAD